MCNIIVQPEATVNNKLRTLLLMGLLTVILTVSMVSPVVAGGDKWHGENGIGCVYQWGSPWFDGSSYCIVLMPTLGDPNFYFYY